MKTTTRNDSDQRLSVNERARGQLGGLTTMFLLGMAVNLIGLPQQTKGGAHTATQVLLDLHILVGAGLIIGAILAVVRAKPTTFSKLAWTGLAAVVLTFFFGGMTIATQSNWWSYAMSVGFIANFWIYGVLFVKTRVERVN